MDKNKIIEILLSNGIEVEKEQRLANDSGMQLLLSNKAVVNLYDKGTFYVQGKNSDEVDRLINIETAGMKKGHKATRVNRKIFVVYGHDNNSRTQLEAMLRRWGLEPLILDQLPSEGQTLIEKLENHTADINFGVVLATPDDEGFPVGHQDEKQYRARQNVVLELGMLLSKLGRSRVAILIKDQTAMERPSDIQGLIYIPYRDSVEETKINLCKEMNKVGYDISIERL